MNRIVKTVFAVALVCIFCVLMFSGCNAREKTLTDICGLTLESIVSVEYQKSASAFAATWEMDPDEIAEFWQLIDVNYQRVDDSGLFLSPTHNVFFYHGNRHQYISVSTSSDGFLIVDTGSKTFRSLVSVRIPLKFRDGLQWKTKQFENNQAIVLLTNDVSNKNLFYDYTTEDFADVGAVSVQEVNPDQLSQLRNRANEAAQNNLSFSAFDYYRALLVTFSVNTRQALFDCLEILSLRADVFSAKPNFVDGDGLPFVAHNIRDNYDLAYRQSGIIVRSVQELNSYFHSIGTDADRLGSQSVVQNYNDEFFSTKMLVVLGFVANSGSIRFTVTNVDLSGQRLIVAVCEDIPQIGTCDMAGWHIFVELDKIEAVTDVFVETNVNRAW